MISISELNRLIFLSGYFDDLAFRKCNSQFARMKRVLSRRPKPPARSPADAAATRAGSSRGRTANRPRFRPVDGRTRAARRWRTLFLDAMRRTGGKHEQFCSALATLTVQRERMDLAAARGELIDALHLVRLSGEIRRLMAKLGLDELPVEEDGTAAAIAALRASHEAVPA